MTRVEALKELFYERTCERKPTTTSVRRIVKACAALHFTQTEVHEVFELLEYVRSNGVWYRLDLAAAVQPLIAKLPE